MLMTDTSNFYAIARGIFVFGYGLSAIYPLLLNIANDYHFTMDKDTTGMLMLGCALGSSLGPMNVGVLLDDYGALALIPIIFAVGIFLSIAYFLVHLYLTSISPSKQEQDEKQEMGGNSHQIAVKASFKFFESVKQSVRKRKYGTMTD